VCDDLLYAIDPTLSFSIITGDVDLPPPEPGEALINIAVAGINYMDTGTRRGYAKAFHTLPMTPGLGSAGTVMAVGDGVTDVKVGDRVAWFFAWGSFVQQVIAPAMQLVTLPNAVDFEFHAETVSL
jgi:NADPH2:quinone reductase